MVKKRVFVLILLVILSLPLYSPMNLWASSNAPATGIQSQFMPSADGDESSASITSFSETLSDDVLFYPDGDLSSSLVLASAGGYTGTASSGDYTNTQAEDNSYFYAEDTSAPGASIIYLNFTVPSSKNIGTILLNVNGNFHTQDATFDANQVAVYDGSTWQDLGDLTQDQTFPYTGDGWTNVTVDASYRVDEKVMFRARITDATTTFLYVDYVEVVFYYPILNDANHYAESFADVSDWPYGSSSGLGAGDYGAGSDGDVYEIWIVCDSTDNEAVYYRANVNIAVVGSLYIEMSGKAETNTILNFRLVFTDASSVWGTDIGFYLSSNNAWATKKASLFSYVGKTIDYIDIYNDDLGSTASGNLSVWVDYLRIAPSTELGWQHDGSTTEGVTAYGGGTLSSNATGLLLTSDADYSWFDIKIDTTATAAYLDPDYYPFLEMEFSSGSIGNKAKIQIYDGSTYPELYAESLLTSTTNRFNMRSKTANDIQFVRIASYISQTLILKWVKAYSIANYTLTVNSAGTDDYLYVSSSALVSNWDTGSVVVDRDPTISVTIVDYQVYNISLSAFSYSDYAVFYIDGSWATGQTADFRSTDYRGTYTGTTITDIKWTMRSDFSLSAIKFIEDATAPTVVRSSVTPSIPADDEAVTLSAVVTDTVEVYTVKFNAITYPAGFSDVDYSATEAQDNLWTYTFTTLTDGYYVFKIIASDAANENSLNEQSYIELTVRDTDGVLDLEDPLLLEWDDVYLNIWANPNKACTLYVYDNSSAMASGSVPAAGSTVRYELDNTEGLHDLDFLLSDGTTSIWPRNDTYYTVTAKWSDLKVVDFVASGTVQAVLGYSWAKPLNGTIVFWQTSLESGNTTSTINGAITVDLTSSLYVAGSYNFEVWTAATAEHWVVPFTVQQLDFTSATLSRLNSYQAIISVTGATYSDQLYDIYVEDYTTAGTSSYVLVANDVLCPAIIDLDVDNSNQRNWKIIAVSRLTDGNYIQSTAFENTYNPGNMPVTEDIGGGSGYNPWTDPFTWAILIIFGAFLAGIGASISGIKKQGDIPNAY